MSEADTTAPEATETPEAQGAEDSAEPTPEAKAEEQMFDAAYVKKLRAEAAKHRTDAQAAKSKLEEREEAEKSELERAQSRLQKSEKAKADAEAKLLRYEVATARNVPGELVSLLTAETQEGLEQQADLILANVKPADPPPATFDAGPRDPAPETKEPVAAHNDAILDLLKTKA